MFYCTVYCIVHSTKDMNELTREKIRSIWWTS